MSDAYLVNLIPQDKPNDIYQAVADKVIEYVKADKDQPIAETWLRFGINRKIVKRNVMTYGYSSKLFGFQDQLIEDLMRPLDRAVKTGELDEHPFGDFTGQREAAQYLARKNWMQSMRSSAR